MHGIIWRKFRWGFSICSMWLNCKHVSFYYKNGNGECVKETITRPKKKKKKQPKDIDGPSTQREYCAPGGVIQLPPKFFCTSSMIMNVILNSEIYKIRNHTRLTNFRGSWLGTGEKNAFYYEAFFIFIDM